MKRVLLVDDMRDNNDPSCSDATVICRNPFDAIILLGSFGPWDKLLIDHDLGFFDENGKEITGYNVMCSLEHNVLNLGVRSPTEIVCVSSNGPGRLRIQQVIDKLLKLKG